MTTTNEPTRAGTAEVLVDHLGSDSYSGTGRREFLQYRDIGLAAATGQRFRALGMWASGENEATGWHYHVCDVQLVYVLQGWVELEFEGGRIVRVKAGESIYIPGGLKHNEIATSDDFQILEVSVPAEMGTQACEPPAKR